MTLTELFTAIANAIREKTGKTESIVAENFPSEIAAIQAGGGNIETCTITVQSFAANIEKIIYFSSENGDFKKNEITYSPAVANVTMNNVVRGSYVHIRTNFEDSGFDYSGNMYFVISGDKVCDLSPDGDMNIEVIDNG